MKSIFKCAVLSAALFTTLMTISACGNKQDEGEKVTVTDMLGETITINKNPKKVACISRTTFDLLVAYGLSDSIDGVYQGALNDWSELICPLSKTIYKYDYVPSYELLLSRGVDLVFAPEKYIADNLKEHGINALNISLYGNPTFENYVTYFSKLVTQIWDSEMVKDKASAWENKVNSTIFEIKNELNKHQIEKKNLYYIRGDKDNGVCYTDTKGSFTEYAYGLLGFNFIGSKMENNKPSKEAICAENPQVFVAGGPYQNKNIELLKTSEPFKNLVAVKNNEIYSIPVGLTMFEQLSAMTPIFLCDQANKLHPNYFSYDISKMIKEDTKTYFDVQLSDVQINYMLRGLNPTGGNLY